MDALLNRRGARLAVSHPEITAMQVRAIFEAALEAGEGRAPIAPEIVVPLVTLKAELDLVRALIEGVAITIARERGRRPLFTVGMTIEAPRAALRAREIAQSSEFFSFDTQALTQMTFGLSRDDTAGFLGPYLEEGILTRDPFASLDREGVGELVRRAAERGRAARPGLLLGLSGVHAGDAASIIFGEKVGLDYVSCASNRIATARLAAAQAALQLSELSEER